MAVDVGCGTGQATLALADHFDSVLGVDISENQISEARKSIANDEKLQKGIEFRWSAIGIGFLVRTGCPMISHWSDSLFIPCRVGSYMHLKELDSASVDLVACCQAIHWFDDIPAYYAEVSCTGMA